MQLTTSIIAISALAAGTLALPAGDLVSRGPKNSFGDWTGSKSAFQDGSGTYVRSYDTYRYGSGDKCWTDLFSVGSAKQGAEWVKQTDIDCGSSSSCSSGQVNATQSCNSWSVDAQIGFDFGIFKDLLGISGSVSTTQSSQQCITASSTTSCTWDDGGCHSTWTSNIEFVNIAYIRRRCDFHNGKGDQTVWSKDLNFTSPSPVTRLGCDAECNESSYPKGIPAA